MQQAGQRLRSIREQLGLTLREVEAATLRLSTKYHNPEYIIPLSRLCEIETKGLLPSIYRLYSLAVIYRRDIRELFSFYGIDLNQASADLSLSAPPKSHLAEALGSATLVSIPVRIDPAFDIRRTANLGRMVERWGVVPLAFLEQFANADYSYGFIGTEDFTMYPILLPGSFVQIDESKNKVAEEMWRSEYERPIYFVETRKNGFKCCWCSISDGHITLQPHPLSPESPSVFRHPQEAEVIGEVVGVAMRLRDWRACPPEPGAKGRPKLN